MLRRIKEYESPFIVNPGRNPHYTVSAWTKGRFLADTGYGRKETPCEFLNDGQFCVHHMIGTHGFSVSYAPLGFRISSRDRVFRTIDWAKHCAEKLYPISNDWGLYATGEWAFPDQTVKIWNYIFDVAETQGAFRTELIEPGDAIRRKPELVW